MCRHNLKLTDRGREYAYGWDSPMQVYFFQVHDLTAPPDKDDLLIWEDGISNGRLLTLLAEHDLLTLVPEEHQRNIAGDLPCCPKAAHAPTPFQKWVLSGFREEERT